MHGMGSERGQVMYHGCVGSRVVARHRPLTNAELVWMPGYRRVNVHHQIWIWMLRKSTVANSTPMILNVIIQMPSINYSIVAFHVSYVVLQPGSSRISVERIPVPCSKRSSSFVVLVQLRETSPPP